MGFIPEVTQILVLKLQAMTTFLLLSLRYFEYKLLSQLSALAQQYHDIILP